MHTHTGLGARGLNLGECDQNTEVGKQSLQGRSINLVVDILKKNPRIWLALRVCISSTRQ